MRAFSFLANDGLTQIGLEYQNQRYNFSLAWEIYKDLKNRGKGPELSFLQVMVEADFLQVDTFEEVLNSLKAVRPLEDLRLKEDVTLLPPIGRPQKILCIGRNYREHARELGNDISSEPVFFSKSPSSVIGSGAKIQLPANVTRVDYEGELAMVVGRRAKNVSTANAMQFIAGFTLLNDVTARSLQRSDQEAGRPWFRSKSFDTFCPLGPYLVPGELIPQSGTLTLTTRVNGEVKQSASSNDMIFEPPFIVSYLSRYCTLEPGDIIATGTPAGVGPLQPGDQVEVSVEELGCLTNLVA